MLRFFFVFLLINFSTQSQESGLEFFKLSSAERYWVVTHLFKSKKAWQITQEVLRVTDSLKNKNTIGTDLRGGHLDAFKHGFWMARMSQEIGEKSALKLGKAHEKGNYEDFKRNRYEDGSVPDKPSSDMDLFNNQKGADLVNEFPGISQDQLVRKLVTEIKEGNLKILKKDEQGRFLNCSGNVLSARELKGTWETQKCLIDSNQ